MKLKPILISCISILVWLSGTMAGNKLSDFNYDSCWLNLIQIEGSTNVNHFSFTYKSPAKSIAANLLNVVNNVFDFHIPVREFKSSNSAMTKDFLDLMKANQFPRITVSFENKDFNNISVSNSKATLNLLITLAGIKKPIKAQCIAKLLDDDKILLQATTEVKLTDFSLTPPEKAFGLIRVKDEVIINFDLIIKTTSGVSKQTAKNREI